MENFAILDLSKTCVNITLAVIPTKAISFLKFALLTRGVSKSMNTVLVFLVYEKVYEMSIIKNNSTID